MRHFGNLFKRLKFQEKEKILKKIYYFCKKVNFFKKAFTD